MPYILCVNPLDAVAFNIKNKGIFPHVISFRGSEIRLTLI